MLIVHSCLEMEIEIITCIGIGIDDDGFEMMWH